MALALDERLLGVVDVVGLPRERVADQGVERPDEPHLRVIGLGVGHGERLLEQLGGLLAPVGGIPVPGEAVDQLGQAVEVARCDTQRS